MHKHINLLINKRKNEYLSMQLNVAAKTDHSVAEQRETCQDGS